MEILGDILVNPENKEAFEEGLLLIGLMRALKEVTC